jgi:signal transduction histidine kinase
MGILPPSSDGNISGLAAAGVPESAAAGSGKPGSPGQPSATGGAAPSRSASARGSSARPAAGSETAQTATVQAAAAHRSAAVELASAGHRGHSLKAKTVAILRLAQLLPWPIAMLLGADIGIIEFELAVSVYAGVAVWSLIWATMLFSRMELPRWSVWVDTAVVGSALVLAPLACYPLDASGWANAALAPALGTAVAIGFGLGRLQAWAAAAVLLAAAAPGAVRTFMEGGSASAFAFAASLANAGTMLLAVLLAALFASYLDRQADLSTRAAAGLDAMLEASDQEYAKGEERVRQYRMLHDTVLSTLSAIARGVDPSDPLVRQRCAADAEYLRSIISSEGLSNANRLQSELATVGRAQAALGLRVHQHVADLPAGLPSAVVHAIAESSREALNNVLKHSGTDQAWITAIGGDSEPDNNSAGENSARITVTVTDRGTGFDPATATEGLGLQQSIIGRMQEVGGRAFVDSSPGHGTTVELQWPG